MYSEHYTFFLLTIRSWWFLKKKKSLLVSVVRVLGIMDWIGKCVKQTVPGQIQSLWDFSEGHLDFCLPILCVVTVVF